MQTEMINTDDGILVKRSEDVSPFLDFAHEKRSIGETGSSDMRYVMTIPPIIVERFIQEAGITFKEFMQNPAHITKLCNDPDYKHLRIWEGRI